ncbi:MAG: winged helix-turn-helix transcriptional regulator [Brevinema sp.]
MLKHKDKEFICSLEYTMSHIGGKWKPLILWHIAKDNLLRYGELKKKLAKISHKVLAEQLKELEADGFLLRKEYPQVPPKVEYHITETGQTLIPLLEALEAWGVAHSSRSKKCKGVK